QQIQMLLVLVLRIVFYAPILAAGGIFKVLTSDTSMGWVIGVAVAAILTIVISMFSIAIPKFKSVQKLVDKLNLITREHLNGMLVIRAFNTQKHEEARFEEANQSFTKTNLFINRVMVMMMPLMMLVMNVITLVIVWVGAERVDAGTMQVGDMMAFLQYTMQIIMAFLMISFVSVMLPRASVSATRIHEVLATEPSITDPEHSEAFVPAKKGEVVFNNVSFRYHNATEDVLKNISFTAEAGKTTAFIGSTGSGKSTLINLIPRFYDVTEGEVFVDGVNIKNVSQNELRNTVSYIPQKGILFSGTIASNITYGNPDATEEQIKKAARIAQAEEFIEAKSGGYNEPISQGGSNVSGGQKQRLSIARALAKEASVYIFDDSFSALDYRTDASLRNSLQNEMTGQTMLIVAQRVSTIKNADKIVVLDEGKVVGIGTHKELLNNCSVYFEIASSQLSEEELKR
ncbi:MAG: ABC transporter ATP-binding protein, partial [Bacilli bacterium]